MIYFIRGSLWYLSSAFFLSVWFTTCLSLFQARLGIAISVCCLLSLTSVVLSMNLSIGKRNNNCKRIKEAHIPTLLSPLYGGPRLVKGYCLERSTLRFSIQFYPVLTIAIDEYLVQVGRGVMRITILFSCFIWLLAGHPSAFNMNTIGARHHYSHLNPSVVTDSARARLSTIAAIYIETALVLLGCKLIGSNSSFSNIYLAELFSGSPHSHGLGRECVLQTLFTYVSLATFTSISRSGEQSAFGLSSKGSGTAIHQMENPMTKQVKRAKRKSYI